MLCRRFFVQPVMWVKAIDIVMDRLVVQGADLSTVIAISGSAQVHEINSNNKIKLIYFIDSNMVLFIGHVMVLKH